MVGARLFATHGSLCVVNAIYGVIGMAEWLVATAQLAGTRRRRVQDGLLVGVAVAGLVVFDAAGRARVRLQLQRVAVVLLLLELLQLLDVEEGVEVVLDVADVVDVDGAVVVDDARAVDVRAMVHQAAAARDQTLGLGGRLGATHQRRVVPSKLELIRK